MWRLLKYPKNKSCLHAVLAVDLLMCETTRNLLNSTIHSFSFYETFSVICPKNLSKKLIQKIGPKNFGPKIQVQNIWLKSFLGGSYLDGSWQAMASMFHIAPTNFANLLADRPAPRGAAGGAGGGPPCKRKITTFKIFEKKATTGSQCDDF